MSLKGLQTTKLRYKPSVLEREKAITQVMKQFLKRFLSPEQIAGPLKIMPIPSLGNDYACKETLFTAIFTLPV